MADTRTVSRPKTVGVLMLETRFPRLQGDIGNPKGFGFPLLYRTVAGATANRVVIEQAPELLEPFILAGHELVADGAELITTSCGFLAYFQKELAEALPVPVYSSALLMMADLQARYGRGAVGILTISKAALGPDVLRAIGIDTETPIGSMPTGCEFYSAIMEDRPSFDRDACEADLTGAVKDLTDRHPAVRALLLECTNMAPHLKAISSFCDRPVFALNDLLTEVAE
ncbi:MAG: aspartate/glutamate racemase family protein [Pseudomonadota bacterium]